MRNVEFAIFRRFATEDRAVDDSLVTLEVIRDGSGRWYGVTLGLEKTLGEPI